MPLAAHRTVDNDVRTTVLRIYSYQDKNLQGTIWNIYYGREMPFYHLTEMLLLMEDLMDQLDFPQATTQNRSFQASTKQDVYTSRQSLLLQEESDWANQKPIATFKLNILFRQSASWQGKLGWTDSGEEESFRSVLELIKLLDSALTQGPVNSPA